MVVIVGLGNPGKSFQKTWHNVGFLVIENIKSEFEGFSDWQYKKKPCAEVSQGKINNRKIILIKPQTFMNDSGRAVKILIKNYPKNFKNLIVIHDDIDLPLGKMRISRARGAAGHKGVQSIINELNTKDFIRFRIGIKPEIKDFKSKKLKIFVLKRFTKKEEKIIEKIAYRSVKAIEFFLTEGLEKTIQKFSK